MYLGWCVSIVFGFMTATVHATAAGPSFLMEGINAKLPLQLQSLHINGNIAGSMAETTVRMVFFNPNSRALEGRLQFPLSARQQITAFALDIDGRMRSAAPIEKATQRQLIEAIDRGKINAGLQEQTSGDNFKLRVYPIPAMGTRTIELKYSETLTRERKDWIYRLPLAYGERLRTFDLSLTIHGSSDVPRVSDALGPFHIGRDVHGYVVNVRKSRFTPNGVLSVAIPTAQHTLTYIHEHAGATYFVAEIPVATEMEGAYLNADGATAILTDAADAQQGLVRVAGKLDRPTATLTMAITQAGNSQQVTIEIPANAPQHPMAATLWAGYQLHALASDYDVNRVAIRRLGKQFAIATRETSLIVLGSMEGYMRHDAKPAAESLERMEK